MSYRSCMRERRQLHDHVIKTSRFAVKKLTFWSFGPCSWSLGIPHTLWPVESILRRFKPLCIDCQLCVHVHIVLWCHQSVTSPADFELPPYNIFILDISSLLVPKMTLPNNQSTSEGPSTSFIYQFQVLSRRKVAAKANSSLPLSETSSNRQYCRQTKIPSCINDVVGPPTLKYESDQYDTSVSINDTTFTSSSVGEFVMVRCNQVYSSVLDVMIQAIPRICSFGLFGYDIQDIITNLTQ